MENLLLKAIMVSIFMWITFFDKYVTQFFTYRPIVVGPIVGQSWEISISGCRSAVQLS